MISLSTTDNNLGKSFSQMGCQPEDAKSAYCDLLRIANAPLEELAKTNPNLLVFPKVLGDNKDDIDKLPLFTMAGSVESEAEVSKVKVTTGNLMGFVGTGESQLEITSRFTPHEPGEPKEDFFLHYMLEKVFALNLPCHPPPRKIKIRQRRKWTWSRTYGLWLSCSSRKII